MAGRWIELRKAIFRLALGALLLLSFALAVPAEAETAVLSGSFTVHLIISNVSASTIGLSTATISWETNGNATSQVFYDTQSHADLADYTHHSDNITALVTQHSISLTGLSSSTTYHYRMKSVDSVDNSEIIAISEDFTFKTKTTGSGGGGEGGGGGGGSGTIQTLKFDESSVVIASSIRIDSAGITQNSGQLTTSDGILTLNVNAGTRLLDNTGQPLTLITSHIPSAFPTPPSPWVILLTYDLGPGGAAFSPPITLILKYKSLSLPQGVSEISLYLAFWNGSEWQALQSIVDTQAKTVSGSLSHFALFALIGKQKILTPPSTPTPTPTLTPTITPAPTTTPTPTPLPDQTIVHINWWWLGGFLVIIAMLIFISFFYLKRPRR
jgi:hypothetical protein